MFVRANVFNGQSVSPSSVPLNAQYLENRTRSIGGSYTHVFNPTLIGTLGVAYTRDFTPNHTPGVPKDLFDRLGLSPFLPPYQYKGEIYIPQSVNFSGLLTSITQRGWFLGGPDYSYNVNGSVTKTVGNHSITGAVNLLKWRHIGEPQPSFNTTFDQLPTALPSSVAATGSPLASFLLGLPTSTFNFNIPYKNINGSIWNLEVRDTWKATRKFTLSLGLEWNLRSGPYFYKDEVSILDPDTGQWRWAARNPITGEEPNLRRTVYDPERNMLAPRLGAAYQLSGTTVLRSGFSRYFDQNNWLIQKQQELLGNYPFGGRQQVVNANNDIPSGITFTNPIPVGLTGVSELNTPGTSTRTDTRTPRVDQWNFGIQQLLRSDTALSVDYVGTRGRHLMLGLRANVANTPGPDPLTSRIPFPQFGPFSINSDYGLSNYHSLQTKLEKRLSRGYTFLASYTFSKVLANTSGPQDSHPGASIYDVRSTYGPANYDVTHAFVASTVVELPFGKGRRWLNSAGGAVQAIAGGWRLSGIVSAYSGFPLTPVLSFDNANTGITPQRPDVVGNAVPAGFQQTRQAWFDTTVFATPTRYTYGNAGWGILRAPGIRNLDFNILKEFRVTESKRFELRFEFFNALNNTNLNGPSSMTVGNANFGRILSAREPRDIQAGLKFVW